MTALGPSGAVYDLLHGITDTTTLIDRRYSHCFKLIDAVPVTHSHLFTEIGASQSQAGHMDFGKCARQQAA